MCVHLNTLPDECLLAIFDLITLPYLLSFDQVCRRWAALLPSAYVRRRTLFFISAGFKPKEISFTLPIETSSAELHDLYFYPEARGGRMEDGFTEMARLRNACRSGQLATYFTDLFPNVNTLVVIHQQCHEVELNLLIGLVGSASWSLVTLKLWFRTKDIDQRYVDRPDQHPIGTLLRAINSQRSSLRQLTLDIGRDMSTMDAPGPLQFTFPIESFYFISQLQVAKLVLHFYDSHNSIWDIVHRFDSANLRQIAIGTSYTVEAALNPDFDLATARKVHRLCCYSPFEDVEMLALICLRFNSLTMLQLIWAPNITFTDLVANLASIPQLIHLAIFMVFEGDRHPENAFALLDRVDGGEEARPISLPQVRVLELAIFKHNHNDFESFSPSVFPAVEMIVLRKIAVPNRESECTICRPNITGQHDHQVAQRCYQLLARSLRSKYPNPLVRMVAYGAEMDYESPLKFKTMALLVVAYVGIQLLFRKILR